LDHGCFLIGLVCRNASTVYRKAGDVVAVGVCEAGGVERATALVVGVRTALDMRRPARLRIKLVLRQSRVYETTTIPVWRRSGGGRCLLVSVGGERVSEGGDGGEGGGER
jgi:hypothetical protein